MLLPLTLLARVIPTPFMELVKVVKKEVCLLQVVIDFLTKAALSQNGLGLKFDAADLQADKEMVLFAKAYCKGRIM